MQFFQLAAAIDGSSSLGLGDSLFVCLMGVGVVFIALVCVVLICKLMSLFFKKEQSADKSAVPAASVAPAAAPVQSGAVAPEKRSEFIAAISAAIADDLGTDVDGIRIVSVKKL